MATGDYYLPSLDFRVPKRRRTERRLPSPPSDSGLTEDEKECVLALLALSRAPVIHDEERFSLLRPEEEEQSKSLPLPSSSPPKQLSQQEQPLPLPPPAERLLSPLPPQQNQTLPLPPPAERDLSPLPPQQNQTLPLPPPAERDLSPLPPQQNQTLPLPPPAERDLSPLPPQQNQILPLPPPAESELSPLPLRQNQPLPLPPPAERALPPLPPRQNRLLPPPPEQALPQVLCPMPIRCYRPPLPPPQLPIQRPTPFVSLTPTQQNQSSYRCLECSKAFSSYQALGGHKTCHRKRPAENSAAASAASVVAGATDQNKLHTCSLCPKSFPTGQALGGHMRAHYDGNKRRATAESRPVAATPSFSLTERSTAKGLGIDLNLPAPEAEWAMEEEAASCQPATSQPPRIFNLF